MSRAWYIELQDDFRERSGNVEFDYEYIFEIFFCEFAEEPH